MTEERFVFVVDNGKDTFYDLSENEIMDMNDTEDMLNELNNENEHLRARIRYFERKIQRERTSHQKEHEKWEDEIVTENEKIKQQRDFYYARLQKIIKIANGDLE